MTLTKKQMGQEIMNAIAGSLFTFLHTDKTCYNPRQSDWVDIRYCEAILNIDLPCRGIIWKALYAE
jgi:hypothetical protein